MLNEHGRLASAAAANVFLIGKEGVATPAVAEGALPGIVRSLLLRHAAEAGVDIDERPIAPKELEDAEIFLTNSLIGLRPAVLRRASPAPRKTFRALQSWYQGRLAEELGKRR
jgi:branched-subunit amino acid aminotransferase/4-amino-4-deoxychorismate lyase